MPALNFGFPLRTKDRRLAVGEVLGVMLPGVFGIAGFLKP
jgi:hypothetical protein